MPKRVLKERPLTVPQVKEALEAIGEEQLDQFQRRSLDYASKFSRIGARKAEELVKELTERFELEELEAVQLVNCMPESVEEIRAFLAGGRRIVEASKLEGIRALLDKYRESQPASP